MPNELKPCRDRLIELMLNAPQMPCIKGGQATGKRYQTFQNIADYLLANGVIVPPCKVGDTVFYIDTCETAEDFGKKFVSFSKVKRMSIDNECAILADHTIVRWRGVFLTKEEAEKALAGRAENI